MAFLEKTEMTLCDPGRHNDFLVLTPKDFTRNDYSPLDLGCACVSKGSVRKEMTVTSMGMVLLNNKENTYTRANRNP